MKIIKSKSDNLVLFAGNDLELVPPFACRGAGWIWRNNDLITLILEDVNDLPQHFIPSGWTYESGIWKSNSLADSVITAAHRAKKIEELQAAAVAAVYADIVHSGETWKADKDSRALLAQVLSVGSVPVDMIWRDAAGAQHPVTYADLQALGSAILTRGLEIDQNLITKTAAANAAATVAEIDAIAW